MLSLTEVRKPLIQVKGLSKSYDGVQALSDVDLSIEAGEIRALVGENGAGKSTLIKCLCGVERPNAGEILVDGAPVDPGDFRAAEHAGVVAIHQESTAFAHLDAVDNIYVGRELRRGAFLLDRRRMRHDAAALLDRLGERLDLTRPLEDLPLAQRQMVGIARALSQQSRLLIMDEPTASLSARETQTLFRIIRQLKAGGTSVLYISHRLEEVFEVADRVTVLRDGKLVKSLSVGELSKDTLVRMMVGRELLADESAKGVIAEKVVLNVDRLTRRGAFTDISFSVCATEVVGLAGLVGAGRSEVAGAIFGIDSYDSGTVTIDTEALLPGSVESATKHGVALVPEDRGRQGLVLPLSVASNLLLSVLGTAKMGLFRSAARENDVVDECIRTLSVKTPSTSRAANTLSGGNQQKLALGKWLAISPRVLILDEPTRGVDVGAKAEIYRIVRRLARNGMATLLISSDLPELLALSDRILVMRDGAIAGELSRAQATEEAVLNMALPVEAVAA